MAKCNEIAELINNMQILANAISQTAATAFNNAEKVVEQQIVQADTALNNFKETYEIIKKQVIEKVEEGNKAFNDKFIDLNGMIEESISANAEVFEAAKERLEFTHNAVQVSIDKLSDIDERLNIEVIVFKDSLNQQFETTSNYILSQCNEMDDAIQELTEYADNCRETVTDLLASTVQVFEEQVQAPVIQLTSNIETSLDAIRNLISHEIVDALSTKLQQEIMQPLEKDIDEAVGEIQNYITQFASNVISGGEDSKQSKQEMDASSQIIEEAIAPVLSALDRVRGLAGTVGISI